MIDMTILAGVPVLDGPQNKNLGELKDPYEYAKPKNPKNALNLDPNSTKIFSQQTFFHYLLAKVIIKEDYFKLKCSIFFLTYVIERKYIKGLFCEQVRSSLKQCHPRFVTLLVRRTDGSDMDVNDGAASLDLDFETQIQHDCNTIRDMQNQAFFYIPNSMTIL